MNNKISVYRPVTWFLLANRFDAVIYADKKNKPFYFVDRLQNTLGKKSEIELVSDREGRVSSSANGFIRHAYEPKESKHEHLAKSFAKRIANHLEHARSEKKFEKLVLVAGPRFLGMIRSELKPAVMKTITHEIKREYLQGSDAEIRKLIYQAIPTKETPLHI